MASIAVVGGVAVQVWMVAGGEDGIEGDGLLGLDIENDVREADGAPLEQAREQHPGLPGMELSGYMRIEAGGARGWPARLHGRS